MLAWGKILSFVEVKLGNFIHATSHAPGRCFSCDISCGIHATFQGQGEFLIHAAFMRHLRRQGNKIIA